MASKYLPKFAVAILALSVVLIMLSAQPTPVAALPNSHYSSTHHHTNWYWDNDYNSYYWWYPYYYYYYPYYYSYYSYPYSSYGSSYCPSNSNNYGNSYSYSSYNYYGYGYNNCPSSYTLTVATNPSSLGTVSGGGSYSSGTSASFSVTQNTVQVSPNSRYVFDHWSGDYSGVGTSGTVTVNKAMTVTAVYQLQYLLSLNAQPQNAPTPQGGDWYNSGATASIQNGGQMTGDSSSRLVFQGWAVDGGAPQTGSTLNVVMDAPHSATALYGQQYYLNVQSDQGVTSGSGWYDAGSTAQISVSTPVSTQYGVSIIFNGWQGDTQSTSQSTGVVVNGPMNVVATWRTDSTVLYLTIAAIIVAAVLIIAGVIAFVVRGRGSTQAPPSQPLASPTAQNNAQRSESNTTPRSEHHRKKATTESSTDTEQSDSTPTTTE